MKSKLDTLYRSILITKFFSRGWGNVDHLRRLFNIRKLLSDRFTCFPIIKDNYPLEILNVQIEENYCVMEGKFRSPFAELFPSLVPKESHDAFFEMILPLNWQKNIFPKPICIHLAGTGDHYFWRRRQFMGKPLLKEYGIAAIILENPFYGLRKPADQVRSNLHYVSDIFVMGGSLILECLVLLKWCEKYNFGPLGISGISMGGHMASLAATVWPKPLVLVPCLSWSTAATVFTQGVMSESIDWEILKKQYYENPVFINELATKFKEVGDPYDYTDFEFTHFSHSLKEGTPNLQKDVDIPNMSNIVYKIWKVQTTHFYETKVLSNARTKSFIRKLIAEFGDSIFTFVYSNLFRRRKRDIEVMKFMSALMDECTHLKNYSEPFDKRLCIFICALDDAYVPREGTLKVEEIWTGVDVRFIRTGHVAAYVMYLGVFRKSIVECFDRAIKYHKESK